MKKWLSIVSMTVVGFMFAGCGGGGPKIVIPSYTAPKEAAKLSKIETRDEFLSDDAYLALWLNPDVVNANSTNPKLAPMLIDGVKAKLTETNFITLDPLGGDEGVTLTMNVSNYAYQNMGKKASMALEVTFTLSRGVDEFLVKKYRARKNRQSQDPSKLPSENELAADAVNKVVTYFISDVSPLKTNQMREFKALPNELQHVPSYAKRKNYKGAIKLMENYKGKKDLNYHYNLAVLYEAEASITENMKLLDYADESYEAAMAQGGFEDEVVVNAKARFDNFYELLSKTKKQDQANQALRNDRDAMAGSSDDEYE